MSICQKCDETFKHIFQCPEGLICPKELQDTQLVKVTDGIFGTKSLHKIGKYLTKYDKYRELIIQGGTNCKLKKLYFMLLCFSKIL